MSFPIRTLPILFVALATGMALPTAQAANLAPPGANPNEKSENGVRATEDRWQHAEEVGDTDYLEGMLAPEYRSVDPDGQAYSKARIIAGAAKRKGSDEGSKTIEAYIKAHPSGTQIVMHGDLAIISFYKPDLGPTKGLKSSDIFVYENGGWHAIYSQHSDASKD